MSRGLFKEYIILLLYFLFPSFYLTYRIYLLGNIPSDDGINIASQVQWLGILYEVFQETLIIPLFPILAKYLHSAKDFNSAVKTLLYLVVAVFSMVSLGVWVFAGDLVSTMSQKESLLAQTADYIRIESIGYILGALFKFGMIVLLILKARTVLFCIVLLQVILMMLVDMLLISQFSFSWHLGVNGIAYSSIIVHLLCVIVIFLYYTKRFPEFIWTSASISKFHQSTIKIMCFSGVESLLRNAVFVWMILKMMNVLSEQGTYWIVNQFIWGWLLVPFITLAELVKREMASDPLNIRFWKHYCYATLLLLCIVGLLYPLWSKGFTSVLSEEIVEQVWLILFLLMPFYAVYTFTLMFQAVFYGLGRTDYILYQSVIINIVYYGAAYYLFEQNYFSPSLFYISSLFGGGLVLSAVLSIVFFIFLKKDDKPETM